MSEVRDWATYKQWHELLDALCTEQGYLDNMALADALCAASGSRTQAAFDTAVKNLRNWRDGIHIPRRRNFILLGKLLKIDEQESLREHWNFLYSQAKTTPIVNNAPDAVEPEKTQERRKSRWAMLAGGGTALAASVALVALFLWSGQEETNADPVAGSFEGIKAEYVRNVSAKVGDSLIIHGARGNACGEAPTWEKAKRLLPKLVTGTLSDGGVGTRRSRQCGGRVPARAILFTATAAGTEHISLYGDDIVIRVTE